MKKSVFIKVIVVLTFFAVFVRHGRRCLGALGRVFAPQKLYATIAAGYIQPRRIAAMVPLLMLLLSACFVPLSEDEAELTITVGGDSYGRT